MYDVSVLFLIDDMVVHDFTHIGAASDIMEELGEGVSKRDNSSCTKQDMSSVRSEVRCLENRGSEEETLYKCTE